MFFGSGKKEMRLYTSYYLFLGKCIFGEFPIKIINWDLKNKVVSLEILQHRAENLSYIQQYISKNSHLGKFRLEFQIKMKHF
jgi:hypothetical protein